MNKRIRIVCLILFLSPLGLRSQSPLPNSPDIVEPISSSLLIPYHLDVKNSQFTIQGTSSLHDWEMVSQSFKGSLEGFNEIGAPLRFGRIDVTVPVKSLVSGKNVMDRKCYDALKYEEHPEIRFRFKDMEDLISTGNKTYSAVFVGLLTVAGQTNSVKINVAIHDKGNQFRITGEKPLKMSDFDVVPPKALLGTLKTGNEITIVFNLNYLKS